MNKETIARQQITIADVHDGEKGAKGDTGARGANGSNGAAAEFYRLQPQTEKAIVASDNVLRVNLEYTIEHVKGAQISVETGAAQGYHLIAWTNQGVFLTMTAGRVNSGTYQMANYSKTGDRPDFINIELRDTANKTLDRRTVQITMEAASFVNVIGDVRETVSQNGKDITTIQQDARGIRLQVESLKSGARNLIKGGQLNRTISRAFAMVNDGELTVKLKPETDYTLTVNGRISSSAWDKRQMLRTYIFDKSWKGFMVDCDIQATSDTTNSVTFRIPKDKASVDNTYCFNCYSFPNQLPQGKNGEVTVNWITLTEGTQPEKAWIPAEGEDVYTQMSKAGMEIKDGEITLTADRTKIRNNKGEDIAVFNEDGTVDARRILMRCRFGNITFGEVDGYPNIIITNALNQPMLMLNHRGIVSPYGADIVLLNCSEYFTRRDEAVLGVNIVVRVTNMGFQEQTFGDNIRLTATLGGGLDRTLTLVLGEYHVKGIAGPGIAVAAKQPVTLKIGETGTLVYGAQHTVGSTAGGNLAAQSVSFSVRATYADKVVDGSYTERLDASDGLPDFSGGLPGGGLPGGGNILSGL